MSTGSKSITVEAAKAFLTDDEVVAIFRSDTSQRLYGAATGYNAGTGVLDFTVANAEDVVGSGTHNGAWLVMHAAIEPFQPPPSNKPVFPLIVEVTPEAYAATAGTAKRVFHATRAYVLSAVMAELSTAQTTGNIFTVDINVNGTTILSTKLTIENTEKTSLTAAAAAVFAGGLGYILLAQGDEITIDIDQVGASNTAKGLKVHFELQDQ
jgi:hypothetical protein